MEMELVGKQMPVLIQLAMPSDLNVQLPLEETQQEEWTAVFGGGFIFGEVATELAFYHPKCKKRSRCKEQPAKPPKRHGDPFWESETDSD